MARDSIIARPTNKVRVMVAEASGCCASEDSAVATARPSASAGIIVPIPMVKPAKTIDATAIIVMLSMGSPFVVVVHVSMYRLGFHLRLSDARGGRDVHRCQDAENVGLHHSGEEAKGRHKDRKDERRNREQDGDNHRPAHHVAK